MLERALATQRNATSVVGRYKPLVSDRSISAQEYDQALSDLGQANGQVSEARAALARAKLQLSFTTVRAPIAGRTGRAEVTEGALVSGTEATLLTRVDQISPVYASFSASSAAILDATQQVTSGDLKVASQASVRVTLILENGQPYGPAGHLDFTSASVDPETGSQIVRATFPNPARVLKPGQFVRGRIEAGMIANGLTIPARAVQLKGEQASVSVLNADGTVANRQVTLGELVGNRWIVRSGVKAGERVIVEGWQKVRPGQKAQAKSNAAPAPAGR